MFHLKPSGMPVGISADSRFTTTTFQLEIGDIVVAYTDGINRKWKTGTPSLGDSEGLRIFCAPAAVRTPQQIIKRILDEVSTFADRLPQRDDMTLVVMQVQDDCHV